MNNAGKRQKTSEARGRQVEAMEGKRKPWKGSRSYGRGAEAVEEDWKLWKRAEETGQGLESNSTLQIDHAPPEHTPTPPATPPIHMPLPAPVEPPAPDLHHTSHILEKNAQYIFRPSS